MELGVFAADAPIFEVEEGWANTPDEPRTVLSVADWNALESASNVREEAKRLVAKLNERLAADSLLNMPLKIGEAAWERSSDSPRGAKLTFCKELIATAHGRASVRGVLMVDGQAVAPPRTRGWRASQLRDRNPHFALAEDLFVKAGDDIRLLWIVYEIVERKSGYKPTKLLSKALVNAFAETANNRPLIRHLGGLKPNQHQELSPQEAKEVIQRLLNAWLDAEEPSIPTSR